MKITVEVETDRDGNPLNLRIGNNMISFVNGVGKYTGAQIYDALADEMKKAAEGFQQGEA